MGGTGLAIQGDQIQTGDDEGGGPETEVKKLGRFQPDEEAVGTLPTRDDEGEEDDLLGPESLPSFFIEGPRSQVLGSFVDMSGEGFVEIDPVDNGSGGGGSASEEKEVRVTFHGRVRLTFDSGSFCGATIKTGISIHEAVGSTIATAMTSHDLLLMSEVPASDGLELPFGNFQRLGLLDDGVHVITSNRIRGRDHIGVSSYGGLIEIQQGLLQL